MANEGGGGSADRFWLRFHGVRGSHPAPRAGTVKYGGNTACLEVRIGKHLIVMDAGTGAIGLGDELLQHFLANNKKPAPRDPNVCTLLLTHLHHDHTQGFPFFKPAFMSDVTLHIFGPKVLATDVEESLTGAMLSPYFPVMLEEMAATKHIRSVAPSNMLLFDKESVHPRVIQVHELDPTEKPFIKVAIHKTYAHPKDGCLHYRIEALGKTLVYATDTEGYVGGDARLVKFSEGADVLIHDGQYTMEEYTSTIATTQGYGHSTPEMAIQVARRAGVGKLILFHHDPRHDDHVVDAMLAKAKNEFPDVESAFEGMEVEL